MYNFKNKEMTGSCISEYETPLQKNSFKLSDFSTKESIIDKIKSVHTEMMDDEGNVKTTENNQTPLKSLKIQNQMSRSSLV